MNIDVELYKKALNTVVENNNASASFIQSKLRIGYKLAEAIIDKMEEDNIISGDDNLGIRKVLVKEVPIILSEEKTTSEKITEQKDISLEEKINIHIENIKTEANKKRKDRDIKELHLSYKILKNLLKQHKRDISKEKIREIKKAITKAEDIEDNANSGVYIIGFIIVLILYCCQGEHKAPIEENALWYLPETIQELKKEYKQTLDKCGIEAIKRSNKLLAPAAEIVSKNEKCDKVIMVMQDDRGSCKDNIKIIVDCDNSTRFILSENEIKSNIAPQSLREKMYDKLSQNINSCEIMIKANLTHPATYKLIDKDYRVTNSTTFVDIKFSSKNGIGLPLEAIGHCSFDSEGMVDFNIEQ